MHLSLGTLVLSLPLFAASPQETFRPHKHLEDFAEIDGSELADVYGLRPFHLRSGDKVTPEELERIRNEWRLAKERGDARAGKIRSDPRERFLYEGEKELRDHPFLGRIDFERHDEYAPFYFYVEPPPSDQGNYTKRVADDFGKWFRQLHEVFDEEYRKALQLTRREDYPAFRLYVLRSQGTYNDYANTIDSPGLYAARAHYEPDNRIAVTYIDYFATQNESKSDIRHPAIHEMVHALQHAHSSGSDELPPCAFFNEGLAEYLSYHEGFVPTVLGEHQLDAAALEFFGSIARHDILKSLLLPLEEIVALEGYREVADHYARRARDLNLPPSPWTAYVAAFYRQSSLWMHYLHQGDGGRFRKPTGRFFAAVLGGEAPQEAFARAFEGVDLDAANRGFLTFLDTSLKRVLKTTASLPRKGLHAVGVTAAAAPAAGGSTADPWASPLSLAALAPATGEAEAGYIRALSLAIGGRYFDAGEALAGLEASGALGRRIRREARRVEAYLAERRRFFEFLREKKRKLNLKKTELNLLAHIEEIGERELHLAESKSGIRTLPMDDIDPLALREAMTERRLRFPATWAADYPASLAGELEELDGSGEELDGLREDVENGFDGYLGRSQAAAILAALGEEPLPIELGRAKGILGRIGTLLSDHNEVPEVETCRPVLERLAAEVFKQRFEEQGLPAVLAGGVETLGNGRLRLSYDFSDEAQLEDFPVSGYLDGHASIPEDSFAVSKDALQGRGFCSLRHALELEGPQVLRARVRFSGGGTFEGFMLGLNDDALGNFLATDSSGGIIVFDAPNSYTQAVIGSFQPTIGGTFTLELRYDGNGTAESFVNGKRISVAETGPRTSGGFFVFSSSTLSTRVDDLSVEGTLTEESRVQLRTAWIRERLESLGFR